MQLDAEGRRRAAKKKAAALGKNGYRKGMFNPKATLDNSQVKHVSSKRRKRHWFS